MKRLSRHDTRCGLLLAAATLIAYWPTLHAGFVWDDDVSLTANRLIQAGDGWRRFWFTTEASDYWPVTSTFLWAQWRLWGPHAASYHAVALALHLTEAVLLWAILRRLRTPGAWWAALLFAVHPVNVESVAWIAQAKNLLAMLFFLISVLAFLSDGTRARVLSLAAFVLGMLSKGSVALLPFVLLGLIAWRRPPRARDWMALVPYFLIGGILAAVDVWFQKHAAAGVIREAGWAERAAGAGAVIWFYLGKALLPLDLSFVYPAWPIRPHALAAWLPGVAAAAVTAFLWSARRRAARPGLFAWGYFLAMLVPVLGFTDVYFMKYSLVADHYQHLALIAVVALAAAGGTAWAGRFPAARPTAVAAAALIVGALAVLTWRQADAYRDAPTLFTATLQRNPDAWLAHNNLGVLDYEAGRWAEAIAHDEAVVRLRPGFGEAHHNLGNAYFKTGRFAEAVAQYEAAIRLAPEFAPARTNLGNALAAAGRRDAAIAAYEDALRHAPHDAEAHNNLGSELLDAGRAEAAIPHFEAAIRANPRLAGRHFNLGLALRAAGRPREAAAAFAEAARLKAAPPP